MYGPDPRHARLDTSAETPSQIRDLSWNRSLVSILAKQARSEVEQSEDSARYGVEDDVNNWQNIFSDRIFRVAIQVIDLRRAQKFGTSPHYQSKKMASKKGSSLKRVRLHFCPWHKFSVLIFVYLLRNSTVAKVFALPCPTSVVVLVT
jgi:hypothetical protein